MKFTRKQSENFVLDPANWEIVPGENEYVRAARMEFKGTTYIRIDEPSIANYIEAIVYKTEPVRTEFRPTHYKRLADHCTISKSQLTAEIYELAKEDS